MDMYLEKNVQTFFEIKDVLLQFAYKVFCLCHLSSSFEMIILQYKSRGKIVRVCMGIFMTTHSNKK